MPYSRSRRSSTSCTHSGETRDQKWTIPTSHSTRIRLSGTPSSHNKMGRCSPSCRGCGWNDWTRKTPNVRSMSPAVRWADIPGRRKCVPHVSLCNGMMRCAAGPPYHERWCYRRFTATRICPTDALPQRLDAGRKTRLSGHALLPLHGSQIADGRSIQNLAETIEARAMTRAIPRMFGMVPGHNTVQVRTHR